MVVCLKLKKAFRKPSADCSSAGTFITHLCSKSSSLISRDGGKENRGNQKDLKKNNRVCSWVLFFSCALSVFSSWIIHVLSGVSFPTSVSCAQNSQRWAKREWAKQSPHKQTTDIVKPVKNQRRLYRSSTVLFWNTNDCNLPDNLQIRIKSHLLPVIKIQACSGALCPTGRLWLCTETTSLCLPENFMLGALRLSKGYDPAL